MHPLTAWVPVLSVNRFHDRILFDTPNISDKVAAIIQNKMTETLRLYSDLSSVLKNPEDVIHLLPMGIYVTFQFRSTSDDIATIIQKLESFRTPGILEFRYALSSVLAEFLISINDIAFFEDTSQNVPPILGTLTNCDAAKLAGTATTTQMQNFLCQDNRK